MKEMKQYLRILGGMFLLYVVLLLFVNTAEPMWPIIKSIEIVDGDIIDCVDVYKQPAFRRALPANNAIIGEIKPLDFTMITRTNMTNVVVHQVWHKSGKCPNKTIPVRRMARNVSRLLNQEYPNACHMEYHKAWSEHDVSGKWCAMYGDTVVGYWPSPPFPEFNRGIRATWGGELCNTYGGQHRYTASQMGSGHVPTEGRGRSAYVRGMEVLEDRGGERWRRPAAEWMLRKMFSDCYRVDMFVNEDGEVWARFGGTGRAAGCCGSYCDRVPSRVVKQYVRRLGKRRGWYWTPADAPF